MRSVWAVVSMLAVSSAFGVACGASSGSEQSKSDAGGAAGSGGSANGGTAGSGVGGAAGQGGSTATGGNATGGVATGGFATGGFATGTGGDLVAGGGAGGNAGAAGGGGMSSGGSAGESSGGSAGMPFSCNEPNVFCPPGTQCACDPANNPNVPATCLCHKRCSSANDCEGTDSLCGCGGGIAEGICVSNCFCLCG